MEQSAPARWMRWVLALAGLGLVAAGLILILGADE